MKGFDCGGDCSVYASRLAGLGYGFGCRYLAGEGDWRVFRRTEAEAMGRAGLLIVSISEMGDGDQFSAALGAKQAGHALARAKAVGQPEGSAIYFAIDSDLPKVSDVIEHFRAIKDAGLPYESAAYGPGLYLSALFEANLIMFSWLANARFWPGYVAFKGREDILQGLPITPFPPDAFQIDPNESAADAGFGEWLA